MIAFKYPFPWLIVLVALVAGCQHPGFTKQSSTMGAPPVGEYGYNLDTLRRFHVPPRTPEESNHYIDMWQDGSLRRYIRAHGLKNNHALFVLSHGSGFLNKTGLRYAYSPDPFNWPRPNPPYFSAQDLARVLGPAECAKIHNLVIAGCNSDNLFSSQELKRYFVNATNIIHAAPGKEPYEFVLCHTLIYQSRDVKFLYDTPHTFKVGNFGERNTFARKSKGLAPYVAELFRPGETRPFKIQIAGRELLDPSGSSVPQKYASINNPSSGADP